MKTILRKLKLTFASKLDQGWEYEMLPLSQLAGAIVENNNDLKVASSKGDFDRISVLIIDEVVEASKKLDKKIIANLEAYEENYKKTPLPPEAAHKEAYHQYIKGSHEEGIATALMQLLYYCHKHNIDIARHIALKICKDQM